MAETERTVQSIFNLWFWNFQNPSMEQYSNLFFSTIAIMEYFNGEKKYEEEIKKTLPALFFHPISELNDLYDELNISKNALDWNISQIEFCYYRDTRFKVKLGKEYFIDSHKEQEKKKLILAEMITILALFKRELSKRIVKILIDEKLEIMISLPSGMKELEQVGG